MFRFEAVRGIALHCAKMRTPSIRFRKGAPLAEAHPSAGAAAGKQVSGQARSSIIQAGDLPRRFLRQPISEEEIDYINRGGPA